MNIFDSLQMYAGKWSVKSVRSFTSEEKDIVASIKVVASQFGKSACFFMKNGQQSYIPLDKDSELTTPVDAVLSFDNIELMTLERMGDADIDRIRVK